MLTHAPPPLGFPVRLFKLPGQLEAPPQEDYGQTVTYKGGIQGAEGAYVLDSTNTLPAGEWADRGGIHLDGCRF